MYKLTRAVTIVTLFTASCWPAIGEDLAVVVNKANPANNLTKSQLRKLVLAEQESWPSGQKVTVVLRTPGNRDRDAVLRIICRMTEDDYNQHSMHASFGGSSSQAPHIVGSGQATRQFIVNTPGAVGFLRMAEVDGTVKILSVDGVGAGQPEYKIKVAN